MKKLLLAVILLLAFNVNAKGATIKDCKFVEELAQVIMEARQSGAAMSDMIEAADGHELSESLVVAAFETPLMSGQKGKVKQINTFKNKAFKICFKSISQEI